MLDPINKKTNAHLSKDILDLFAPELQAYDRLLKLKEFVESKQRERHGLLGPGSQTRPLDTQSHSELRKEFIQTQQTYPEYFPCLSHFEIVGPNFGNGLANCLGWAAGTERLKGIVPAKGAWNIQGFDELYGQYGFNPLPELDFCLIQEIEKVLIYGLPTNDGSIKLTHAIVQEPDGSWTSLTSKSAPLMRLLDPYELSTNRPDQYGIPIRMYGRARQNYKTSPAMAELQKYGSIQAALGYGDHLGLTFEEARRRYFPEFPTGE